MQNFPVKLPDNLKKELGEMAKEVGLTQSQLIRMAAHSLVANYKAKGTFIFMDLLNPDKKN